MNDFEVMDKYIKEYGLDKGLEKLTYLERVLYKCQLRDTLQFSIYLVRFRILEFVNKLVDELKGQQYKKKRSSK